MLIVLFIELYYKIFLKITVSVDILTRMYYNLFFFCCLRTWSLYSVMPYLLVYPTFEKGKFEYINF